jgi:FkbM family methyltransferase
MRSQNNEEAIIAGYFQGFTGKFLDIGAYDGLDSSNTAHLVEAGWSGVMVEPAPIFFMKLLNNHGKNPKLTLVNCALGGKDDFGKFHYTEQGGVSTFCDMRRDNWTHQMDDFRDYFVPIIDTSRFIKSFPGPYDCLDIDAEGMDASIIEKIPLDGVRLVCIEYGWDSERIKNCMKGFNLIYTCAENYIFAR